MWMRSYRNTDVGGVCGGEGDVRTNVLKTSYFSQIEIKYEICSDWLLTRVCVCVTWLCHSIYVRGVKVKYTLCIESKNPSACILSSSDAASSLCHIFKILDIVC